MKKKIIVLLLALLILPGASPAVSRADTETIRIPATLTAGFYRNDPNGLSGFLANEEVRCIATICAYLDWQAYDKNADCLTGYTYIGKDREGNVLWIGLGGKTTSIVLMYAPDIDPDYYTAVPVALNGTFVSSFIDIYCDPLYHNDKATMESVANALVTMAK